MITKGTQEYKKAQQIANRIKDLADCPVSEETAEEAKETMTKEELTAWLRETNNQGNSVYYVVNGAGISRGYGDEIDNLIDVINSESYDDVIEVLGCCEEYDDFACTMLQEEFNEAKYLRVKHNTSYNSENIDIQIAYYNL